MGSATFKRLTPDQVAAALVARAPSSGLGPLRPERVLGWSLCLSKPGFAYMSEWALSARRLEFDAPNELDLAFVRDVAKACGCPDDDRAFDRPGANTWLLYWAR